MLRCAVFFALEAGMKMAKFAATLLAAGTVAMVAPGARAQDKKAAPGAAIAQTAQSTAAPTETVANPVSTFVKAGVARYEKNMVAAAEAMPADKYGYKPTPDQSSYGHLIMHIAQSNTTFCSKISGQAAPDSKIAETDSKEKLVAALKESFAFCTTSMANVDDSKLGEQFIFFGGRPLSRGGALVALAGSWTDHYATQAMYLRLNGVLPPTAQPKKD